MQVLSIVLGTMIVLFASAQLYIIVKGKLIQATTFFLTIMLFLTGLALISIGKLFIILLWIPFLILLLAHYLPALFGFPPLLRWIKLPSPQRHYYYLFTVTLIYLFNLLTLFSQKRSFHLITVYLIGFFVFVILLEVIRVMSNKIITKEDREKYANDLIEDMKRKHTN